MASHSDNKTFAPVALFVFNRPEHTLQALTSLSTNPEFLISPLFIYCDGARNVEEKYDIERTRDLVRNWEHPIKTIFEAEQNRGLAISIFSGVTELLERFDKVIVVEDDLVVSNCFLSYLNSALKKYQNTPQVMQVSAYMFPILEFSDRNETLFLPNISSWGWATWDRAWRNFDLEAKGWESLLNSSDLRYRFNVEGAYDYSDMLLRQMSGEIDSWAIRWNWSVFRHDGLVSYPPTSFVRNAGFDGSGTHCATNSYHDLQVSSSRPELAFAERIEVSKQDIGLVKDALLVMRGSALVRMLKIVRSSIRRIKLRLLNIVVSK